MSRTAPFLAETRGSATIDEQKASLQPDDEIVLAGEKSFAKLAELLAGRGLHLSPGDRIKVFDLSCVGLSTPTLLRMITRVLQNGVTFEITAPGIVIQPGGEDKLHAMVGALHGHYRHLHGIKTNPIVTAPKGRKRLLDPDQLPAIREKLNRLGATTTDVARELGVARSTLFNYLERYDLDRPKRAEKLRSPDFTDEEEPSEGVADRTSA